MGLLYAGKLQSYQKTAARALAYSYVRPNRNFLNKHHIVIASRECGDIRHLSDHGVPIHQVIACDLDPVARWNAVKLGATVAPTQDIADTVAWFRNEFGFSRLGSINIDLCGAIKTVTQVVNKVLALKVPYSVPIFATFCCNRKGAAGMGGKTGLLKYFQRELVLDAPFRAEPFFYQSSTPTNSGSPMCMVVI